MESSYAEGKKQTASQSPTTCYCGGQCQPQHLLCHFCAADHLSSKIARYSSAKKNHLQKKRECQLRLLETRLLPAGDCGGDGEVPENFIGDVFSHEKSKRCPLPDPNQINKQVIYLKKRLDMLRRQSNDLAVRVTARTMENEEREANLVLHSKKVILAQERLDRMNHYLLSQSEDSIRSQGQKKCMDDMKGDVVGDGRLRDALDYGRHQIQSLRFQCALRVFDMHRIDVGEEYSNQSKCIDTKKMNKDNASGVGKIGGLPLPHAGPALYGVLPQGVLASSLRLVATLTNLVARCLGVVLPHPILVCGTECHKCGELYSFGSDVIDEIVLDDNDISEGLGNNLFPSLCNSCCEVDTSSSSRNQKRAAPGLKSKVSHSKLSSSTATPSKTSLVSFVGASAWKAMAFTSSATSRAITNKQHVAYPFGTSTITKASEQATPSQLMSRSPSIITNRINHASFAVLAESNEQGATEYVLNPPRLKEDGGNDEGKTFSPIIEADVFSNVQSQLFSNREDFHSAEERFSIGVQLLQNDVIALCFRAGVDVSNLWPAESVLLNLNALLEHCLAIVNN